jgi:formamidopyrimidine-DNA glycosylase
VKDRFFLYDDTENTRTRFVSFVGENQRYDLAIVQSDRHYGKYLLLNMQGNRYAIVGPDDLAEEGYLEYAFQISEEEAEELKSFLMEIM